jgi:hypothetical protein
MLEAEVACRALRDALRAAGLGEDHAALADVAALQAWLEASAPHPPPPGAGATPLAPAVAHGVALFELELRGRLL